jgi:hypothetical protein
MKKLTIASAACLVLVACGPVYTNEPGPFFPPAVVGMEWVSHPPSTNQCAVGLMADGGVAVVSAFNFPAGVAAGWLTWSIGQDGPPGHSLVDCWNVAQWNWPNGFNLYVKCYGQPVIRSTWNDFGAASAWVKVPFCQCNISCQQNLGLIESFWREPMGTCSVAWQWDWMCLWAKPHSSGGQQLMMENPPGDPPPAYIDGQALPTDFAQPNWNVTDPLPISPCGNSLEC